MIEFNSFNDAQTQAEALSQAVAKALRAVLTERGPQGRATLAVSGGKSPVAFFEHLSRVSLDWARIDLTLVDDRWVPEDHADSNASMVRTTLLHGAAAAARFVPLVDTAQHPQAAVAALNRADTPAVPDVAVLGMGEDGHTASIFADAPEWELATTTTDRFVLVHPGNAPHARVSWSLDALKRIGTLFLQIGGEKKRAVLDAAAALPERNAISRLAVDEGVTLHAYWFA